MKKIRSTTVLAVCRDNETAIGADGQVTFGDIVMKGSAKKIRTLNNGQVLAGFAGSTADALTLFESFEEKLEIHQGQLVRAAVELTKEWRIDKSLRRLEALLVVADLDHALIISGSGDVIEPEYKMAAVGSGAAYAQAAARSLMMHTKMTAKEVVSEALKIAADTCIYTNHSITVESLKRK